MEPDLIFRVATQILLFVVLITAAVTDLRDRKVYNWLTFPAIAFGLTLAWATGSWDKLQHTTIFAFLPAVLIFGILVWIRGMGAGDMKLMAAIAAIMGSPFFWGALFWSAMAGAIIALGMLAWQGLLLRGLGRSLRFFLSVKPPDEGEDLLKKKIPYGVAISAGTMFNWFLIEIGGVAV